MDVSLARFEASCSPIRLRRLSYFPYSFDSLGYKILFVRVHFLFLCFSSHNFLTKKKKMLLSNHIADDETKHAAIRHLERQFDMNTDQLKRISTLLQAEMETGLKRADDCNCPMLPSYITRHPSGQEKGEYLGLDLSGKNHATSLNLLHEF